VACLKQNGFCACMFFSVLSACNVTSLPQKYFLDRWRNDLKRMYTFMKSSCDSLSGNSIAQKYDDLCKDMHKLAVFAITNMENYTKAKKYVHMLMNKFSGSSSEPSPPSQALVGAYFTYNESMDGVENDKVCNLLAIRGKGKPLSKRKMSSIEKAVKRRTNQSSDTNPKQKRRQNQVIIIFIVFIYAY
jgi:hypothetical protein